MEPSKKKPPGQDENPMADYNPKNRNFQNTEDAPVSSAQKNEEEDEFDDYDEVEEEEEDDDETKDQTV